MWQGLADVDAIYRLTQPQDISFEADAPLIVLPEGTMAPHNSQNTLFTNDALWGLVLPVTVTFRFVTACALATLCAIATAQSSCLDSALPHEMMKVMPHE